MKKCHHCAEDIQDEAIKCRFCGEKLSDQPSAKPVEAVEEKILVKEHPVWLRYINFYSWAALFLVTGISVYYDKTSNNFSTALFLIGFGIFLIVVAHIQRTSRVYTITNKRVQSQWGVFTKQTDQVDIQHIRNVTVKKGFVMDEVLGNIFLGTSGTAGNEIIFVAIARPSERATLIKNIQSNKVN